MKGWGKTGDTSDSSLCDVLFEADAHRPFQRHLENQWPVVLRCLGNRVLHYSTLRPNNLWWGNKKKTKADLILDWETKGQVLIFLSGTTGGLSSPCFIWSLHHKLQHEMTDIIQNALFISFIHSSCTTIDTREANLSSFIHRSGAGMGGESVCMNPIQVCDWYWTAVVLCLNTGHYFSLSRHLAVADKNSLISVGLQGFEI